MRCPAPRCKGKPRYRGYCRKHYHMNDLHPMGPTSLRILGLVLEDRSRSLRDLARLAGLARNAVWKHLRTLQRRGLVSWEYNLGRTLTARCWFDPLEERIE